eukprot:scaffold2342_cov248-Ochromonas_danica.AAC.2
MAYIMAGTKRFHYLWEREEEAKKVIAHQETQELHIQRLIEDRRSERKARRKLELILEAIGQRIEEAARLAKKASKVKSSSSGKQQQQASQTATRSTSQGNAVDLTVMQQIEDQLALEEAAREEEGGEQLNEEDLAEIEELARIPSYDSDLEELHKEMRSPSPSQKQKPTTALERALVDIGDKEDDKGDEGEDGDEEEREGIDREAMRLLEDQRLQWLQETLPLTVDIVIDHLTEESAELARDQILRDIMRQDEKVLTDQERRTRALQHVHRLYEERYKLRKLQLMSASKFL